MKKILIIIGVIISLFSYRIVHAETFSETSFISGEYITKEKDGKKYYLTVQFIEDNYGNKVYCLEPFVFFNDSNGYKSYTTNFSLYTGINAAQMDRIQKLAYYGYGYNNRIEDKWYAITQLLIWQTVAPENAIYFTDKLNGSRIDKYTTEINEIENDIARHNKGIMISNTQNINYKERVELDDLNSELHNYEIKTSNVPAYIAGDKLIIDSPEENGSIKLIRYNTDRLTNMAVFVHSTSQKLIRAGKLPNENYNINVVVEKGAINLDILDDNEEYSVDKDFSNTCYEITNEKNEIVDKVCTKENLKYKTNYLPYGSYKIKQTSVGVGYLPDTQIYSVIINKSNQNPSVELKNKLIKNSIIINKQYCKNNICKNEANAEFNIINSKGEIVYTIKTNEEGTINKKIGYGKYSINQIKGKEGYSFVDEFKVSIEDETSKHQYNLYNNWIEAEQPVIMKSEIINPIINVKEPDIDEKQIEEETAEKIETIKKDEKHLEDNDIKIEQTSRDNYTEQEPPKTAIELESIIEEEPPKTGVERNIISIIKEIIENIIDIIKNYVKKLK